MSTAVRRGLYGKLAGDTTLTNLLPSPPSGFSKSIYFELAPQEAEFPYVVFSKQSSVPAWAFGAELYEDELWLIKAVDKASTGDTADSISSRIVTLLNDSTLSISGMTKLLWLRRESDTEYSEVLDGERVIHSGSSFRLMFE